MHANARRRRLDSVGKTHSPRQVRLDSVAAVAGEKATEPANSVADCGRGRSEIEGPQAADAYPPALKEQSGDTEHEAAEPRKPGCIPKDAPTGLAELAGRVDHVPELGAYNSSNHGNRHHADRVGFDSCALKAAIHYDCAGHSSQPQH